MVLLFGLANSLIALKPHLIAERERERTRVQHLRLAGHCLFGCSREGETETDIANVENQRFWGEGEEEKFGRQKKVEHTFRVNRARYSLSAFRSLIFFYYICGVAESFNISSCLLTCGGTFVCVCVVCEQTVSNLHSNSSSLYTQRVFQASFASLAILASLFAR